MSAVYRSVIQSVRVFISAIKQDVTLWPGSIITTNWFKFLPKTVISNVLIECVWQIVQFDDQ